MKKSNLNKNYIEKEIPFDKLETLVESVNNYIDKPINWNFEHEYEGIKFIIKFYPDLNLGDYLGDIYFMFDQKKFVYLNKIIFLKIKKDLYFLLDEIIFDLKRKDFSNFQIINLQ